MKAMQQTTPGFVLTSLSFKPAKTRKNKQQQARQFALIHNSSITKFDYCLPPDELNGGTDYDGNFNAL